MEQEQDKVLNIQRQERNLFVLRLPEREENVETEEKELDDAFFELTKQEVKKLLLELEKKRTALLDAPLLTAAKRQEIEENQKEKLLKRGLTVLRIQFPDKFMLQAEFHPNESIGIVKEFIKKFLKSPEINFYLYSSPPKSVFKDTSILLDLKLVPAAKIYFGSETSQPSYLLDEMVDKLTSFETASLHFDSLFNKK